MPLCVVWTNNVTSVRSGGRSTGRLSEGRGSARGAALAGEGQELVQVLEVELRADAAASWADPNAGAERRLERLFRTAERGFLIGVGDDLGPLAGAGLLRPPLGLADGPAPGRGLACEGATRPVAPSLEDRPAVPLAQVARGEQVEDLVGKVEQTDEVRDRGPTAAQPPRQLLLAQPQILAQRRAGASFVPWIEVLARHVLDQRRLQAPRLALA